MPTASLPLLEDFDRHATLALFDDLEQLLATGAD